MFCSNCGFKLLDEYKYCPECGTKIIKNNNDFNINPLALLVLVSLLDGSTRSLYFLNNCYYSDKECKNIFPLNLIANPFNHKVINENEMVMFMGIGNIPFKK